MYYYTYNSTCTEENQTCSKPPVAWTSLVMQWCDKSCNAGCENDNDCKPTSCTNLSGCIGGTYYNYTDQANNCVACNCEANICQYTTIPDADICKSSTTISSSPASSGGSGGGGGAILTYYRQQKNTTNTTINDTIVQSGNEDISHTGLKDAAITENNAPINPSHNATPNTANDITGNVIGNNNIFKPINIIAFVIILAIIGALLYYRKRLGERK
jgi:hypothetical protein